MWLYFVTFLEGILTFLSPCLLPMLPVYISYFAGGEQRSTAKTFRCALGFVLGFSGVFTAMGLVAGTLGGLLGRALYFLCGAVMVVLGLGYMGLFQLPALSRFARFSATGEMRFGNSVLLGMVFAVCWSPCVGTFLGVALVLAAQQAPLQGFLMLCCFSAGLGIPFLLSALLRDQLRGFFARVKKSYRWLNLLCGGCMILLGLLTMTGKLQQLLSL